MARWLQVFANNLLPIFFVAGSGYLLGRLFNLDARPVSKLVFYLLTPALVFDLLYANPLDGGLVVTVAGVALLSLGLVALLAWGLGRWLRLERAVLAALILTAVFPNAGNYGLPLVKFTFGEQALAFAGVYFILTSVLFNTLGVFIASLGHLDVRASLRKLFSVPLLYAVALALWVSWMHWQLPLPLTRTLDLLSDSAIPMMLVLLGLELRHVRWGRHRRALLGSLGLRLLAAPAAAWAVFAWMGGGSASLSQALLVESAMPTAVSTTVLAAEFDLDASFVTMAILSSTLVSPLTVTALLIWLGR